MNIANVPLLIFYTYPHGRRSTANRQLIEAITGLPGVEVGDLYERYPNYDIDVRAEREAARKTDLIVFQYPTQWYGPPPLLKL